MTCVGPVRGYAIGWRLCHLAGGELEQIQFLLGHTSVETTERYLGCNQKLSHAVNDNLGLEDT
jgi:integrase